jgi:hypothetical protein
VQIVCYAGKYFVYHCSYKNVLSEWSKESQDVLKLNGAQEVLACVDDINLCGQIVNTGKKKHTSSNGHYYGEILSP